MNNLKSVNYLKVTILLWTTRGSLVCLPEITTPSIDSVKNNKSIFIFKFVHPDLELLLCGTPESLNKGSHLLSANTSPISLVSVSTVSYFIRPLLQICIIQCSFKQLAAVSGGLLTYTLNQVTVSRSVASAHLRVYVSPGTLDVMVKF